MAAGCWVKRNDFISILLTTATGFDIYLFVFFCVVFVAFVQIKCGAHQMSDDRFCETQISMSKLNTHFYELTFENSGIKWFSAGR